MEERLLQNARAYASQFRLQLAERLGSGVHGIVLVTENNAEAPSSAKQWVFTYVDNAPRL
jgi:hypothetical protein